jgi:hypothetical protein
MDCVVSPVDQVLPVASDEVNVTLPPVQNVVAPPAVMVGAAGPGETETVNAGEVLLHHLLKPVVVVTE